MSEGHHCIPQQRIKQRRSHLATMDKIGRELTEAERRLLDTPLHVVLNDRRNIVRLSRARHHRAHHFERLTRQDLPAGIEDFAVEYALEAALDHELRLIDGEAA